MPCRWKRAVGGGRSPSLAAPDGVPWSRCLYGPTARGDKRLPIVLQRSLQHCRWLGASGRLSILRGAPFAPEGGPRVAARWRPLWNARAAESQSASSDFLSCGNSERRDLSTSSSSSKDRDLGVGGSCEAAVCPRQLGRRRAAALLRSTTTGSNSDGFPWNEEGLPAAFWRVSKGAAASGSSHGTAFHSPSEIVGGRKDADEDALSRRGLPAESAENAEMVAVARRRRRSNAAAAKARWLLHCLEAHLEHRQRRQRLQVATTRSLLSEDAAVSGLAALGQYLPPHLLAAAAGVAARTVPVESAAWRRAAGGEDILEETETAAADAGTAAASAAQLLRTARMRLHELGPVQLAGLLKSLARCNSSAQQQQQQQPPQQQQQQQQQQPPMLHSEVQLLRRSALPALSASMHRLRSYQASLEAQAVAWFVLRHCQHHKTLAVLQKLREVLLSQLSLLSHQQRLQQQCRGLWPAPSLRDAASLATALLQCGTLDGYLLQQLWRAVCRSFLEDARAVALGGETSSLSAAAVRSVAVRAPPERVAVDGRSVAPSQALSAFCCALPLGALPDALHAAGSSVDPSFGGFVFSLSQDFAWAAETPRDRFAAAQLLHLLASLASPAAAVTDTPLLQAVAAAVRARLLNPSNSNSNSASCGSSNTSLQLAVAQHIACCWIAVARLLLAVQESRDLAAAAVYPQLHPEEAHCLLAFRNSSKDSRLLPPTEAFAMFFDDVLKPSAAVLEALVAAEAADPIANFNAADPIRQSAEEQLHARLVREAQQMPRVAAALAAAAGRAQGPVERLVLEEAAAIAAGAAARAPPSLLRMLQQSHDSLLQLRTALAKDLVDRTEPSSTAGDSRNEAAAAARSTCPLPGDPRVAVAWACAAAAANSCDAPAAAVDAALVLAEEHLVRSRRELEEATAAVGTAATAGSGRVAVSLLQQLAAIATLLHALSACGARRRATLHSLLPGLRRAIYTQHQYQQQQRQQQQEQGEQEGGHGDIAFIWQCWADIFLSLVELQATDALGVAAALLHAQLVQQAPHLNDPALLLLLQAQLLLCCGSPQPETAPLGLQAASTTRTTLPGPTELTCGSDAPKDAYRAPLFLQLIDQDGGQAQPGAVLRGLLLEAERRQRCLSLLQSPEQLVLLAFALHFFEGLDSMGAARCSKLQQLARRLSWRREAIVAAATAAAPDTAAAVASMEGNMKRRPFFSSASPCRYQDVPLLLPAAARHSGSSSSGVALQLGNSPRSWTDRWVWLFAAEAIALRHAAAAKGACIRGSSSALSSREQHGGWEASESLCCSPVIEGWIAADGCVEGGVSGPSPSPGEQPVLFLLSRRNFW
ncbi:uncharacterized protein LOC34622541 [Cyclospora cayetanensis]|uniref:Uncharacterized protein LOC34622541 n=1 Tax=Cyclospora cayetanensis TaxID=88456 RepID=A0A6P6RTJ3_9EIME|nr:uncharacterized protein LOC34622541 [Cyclospora cayetanensis]